MLVTLGWVELFGPYGLLALAGALLWMNMRTAASMLAALGFVAAFIGQIGAARVGAQIATDLSTKDFKVVTLHYYHQFGPLFHYLALVGIWVAALAFVWVAMQARRVSVS